MYFFIQGTTALILILAANTGYSAFPLLAVNLAKDKFIPRMFLSRGDRLGYSNGIIILGIASIILILVFHAETEHLIPLYAVGVFVPFTLSQTGMMVKWFREKPEGWIAKFIINTIGAFISFHRNNHVLFNQISTGLVYLNFCPNHRFCFPPN